MLLPAFGGGWGRSSKRNSTDPTPPLPKGEGDLGVKFISGKRQINSN